MGLKITVNETESSVGDFNVDTYATEIGTDRKIIIENQLEDSNHEHHGKHFLIKQLLRLLVMVKSKPLTKEQAKKLQEKAQKDSFMDI